MGFMHSRFKWIARGAQGVDIEIKVTKILL